METIVIGSKFRSFSDLGEVIDLLPIIGLIACIYCRTVLSPEHLGRLAFSLFSQDLVNLVEKNC
jgi:hypothetical protein